VVNTINTKYGESNVQAARASSLTAQNLAFTAATGTSGTININGVDITVTTSDAASDVIDKINAASDQTGVSATTGSTTGIALSANSDITVTVSGGGALAFDGQSGGNQESYLRGIELSTDVGGSISVAGTDNATLGFTTVTTTDKQLADTSVATRQDASDALKTVDFALQQVNSLRAQLGAVQNRFESTISNLATTTENLSASRSRIQDADFAAETANLTKAQILQQAGTSVLSQANSIPQNVLSLLQ
jgi:flagellin